MPFAQAIPSQNEELHTSHTQDLSDHFQWATCSPSQEQWHPWPPHCLLQPLCRSCKHLPQAGEASTGLWISHSGCLASEHQPQLFCQPYNLFQSATMPCAWIIFCGQHPPLILFRNKDQAFTKPADGGDAEIQPHTEYDQITRNPWQTKGYFSYWI